MSDQENANKTAPLQVHIDTILQEHFSINESGYGVDELEDAIKAFTELVHHRERIARIDELKYLLSLGEDLYFPYGRSDKVISDRTAELNKEEHE